MSSRASDDVKPNATSVREANPFPPSRHSGSIQSLVPPVASPRLDSLSAESLALEMQNRELRESQRTLERARNRYFELFDAAPVAYVIFDERHHLEELNAAAVELLGEESARWRHRPFFPHLLEGDRQRFHQHLQSVFRDRQREEVELSVSAPHGDSARFRMISQLVLPEPGLRPVCLSALLPTPVNDKGFGGAPGIAREVPWGRHLAQSGIPAAVAAVKGGWLQSNSAFRSCLEYTEEELQSRSWIALTHPEDREREVGCYNRMLAGDTDAYQLEKRMFQKSGTLLRVRASVSCTRAKDGSPELLFYTLQLLGPSARETGDRPSVADEAWCTVELRDLLSECRAEFADPNAPCRLRWSLPAGVPPVQVKRRALLGALRHLVQNALEAIGSGPGHITVSVGRQFVEPDLFEQGTLGESRCSGDCIFLEVADEGCGMSADLQSRVCEPHFTNKPGHSGMGLTIVATVMRELRGGIRIYSQQGKGTSVKLIFPEAFTEAKSSDMMPPHAILPSPAGVGDGRQRRVLLVDDETEIRDVTARMIEALGFEVEEAAGGAEGLALYMRHPERFFLVVADITMPGMDGLQLFDQVRQHRQNLPFVLMSGFCETSALSHREEGLGGQPGTAAFLQKPFTFHLLQEALESVQRGSSWL